MTSLRIAVRDPWFAFGLVLRLGLIALLAGAAGTVLPMPPPPFSLLWHMGDAIGASLDGMRGARIAASLLILMTDMVLAALVFHSGRPRSKGAALRLYWLSPIILYVNYAQGSWAVIPVALIFGVLVAIQHTRYRLAAITFGVSLATGIGAVFSAPFFALYFLARPRLRKMAHWPLVIGAAAILVAWRLLANDQWGLPADGASWRNYMGAALNVSRTLQLYILPIIYFAVFYWAWRVRRLDFALLRTFIGMCFIVIAIAIPADSGWAVWAAPFLVLYAIDSGDITASLLYWLFCVAFVMLHLTNDPASLLVQNADFSGLLTRDPATTSYLSSLFLTVMTACGIGLFVQMSWRWISLSPFRLLLERPIAIGIAGDSGAGKDAMADCITAMFGKPSVAHVSGDDYHMWDRQKPMWRALTHLNPQANDLESFSRNVVELIGRRPAIGRHYDHTTGRMTKAHVIHSADVVIASGLHALTIPSLNARYDIRIYLDIDEGLRRHWKVQRDVHVRNHPLQIVLDTIERRWPDSVRYIHPQKAAADLVMSLEPRNRGNASWGPDVPLRLRITNRRGTLEELSRLLISLCNIDVIEVGGGTEEDSIMVIGELSSDDVAAAARHLAPALHDMMDVMPVWETDLKGVMQLAVLDQLARVYQFRSKRP
jgi:uridine kinase